MGDFDVFDANIEIRVTISHSLSKAWVRSGVWKRIFTIFSSDEMSRFSDWKSMNLRSKLSVVAPLYFSLSFEYVLKRLPIFPYRGGCLSCLPCELLSVSVGSPSSSWS